MADIVKKEYALTEVETSKKIDKMKRNHRVPLDTVLVRKILRLTLKLAYAGVYNDKLNLILNSSEIKRPNFVKYLILAVSDKKSVIAWPASFLTILTRSNIAPADIMNESLKILLRSTHKKKSIIIDKQVTPSYSYPVSFPNIHADLNEPITSQSISDTGLTKKSQKTRKSKFFENEYENIRFSDRIADKKRKFELKHDGNNAKFGKSKWTRIHE